MKQQEFEYFISEFCAQLRTASPAFSREFGLIAKCLDDALAHLKEQQAKLEAQKKADDSFHDPNGVGNYRG